MYSVFSGQKKLLRKHSTQKKGFSPNISTSNNTTVLLPLWQNSETDCIDDYAQASCNKLKNS